MEEFNINSPFVTTTVKEELVWDCTKEAFYECKHNVQTIINERINWCMEEIERLRSLDILCWEDLEKYATEIKYLQTTVSGCMLNLFYDLEIYIDKGFAWEQPDQMAVQWTGDKFIQGLFYDIFEKLNLEYSLDTTRCIMIFEPKLHTVKRVTKTLNLFGGVVEDESQEE